jgi:hypothetical protein
VATKKQKNQNDALLSPMVLSHRQRKIRFKTTSVTSMTSNQQVVARPEAAFQRRTNAGISTQTAIAGRPSDRVLTENVQTNGRDNRQIGMVFL